MAKEVEFTKQENTDLSNQVPFSFQVHLEHFFHQVQHLLSEIQELKNGATGGSRRVAASPSSGGGGLENAR